MINGGGLDYGTRPESFGDLIMGADRHVRTTRNTVIPDYRQGQGFFNYVYHWFPDVADEFRATPVDCFYQDALVNAFLESIRPYFE